MRTEIEHEGREDDMNEGQEQEQEEEDKEDKEDKNDNVDKIRLIKEPEEDRTGIVIPILVMPSQDKAGFSNLHTLVQ